MPRTMVLVIAILAPLVAGTARSGGCPGIELEFPAGIPDDFALPTEPTFQSPEYAEFLVTSSTETGQRHTRRTA